MSINAKDIGKPLTLTKGTDTLTGALVSINNFPEIIKNKPISNVRQIPDSLHSDYLLVQTAGHKTIVIRVQITAQNKNSPILLDISGITTYNIENELYYIQLVAIVGTDLADITLIDAQVNIADPSLPEPVNVSEAISFILHYDTDPANDYTLTGLVEGEAIKLMYVSGDYKLIYQVYRYSDDDKFLSDVADGQWLEKGFTVTQSYKINGVTKTETWENNDVVELTLPLPKLSMSNKGIPTEVVEYSMTSDIPTIRTLSN